MALLAILVLAACDSTSSPPKAAASSPTAGEPEEFDPLPKANPPQLESKLTPEELERCLYPKPIDIESLAGVYTSVPDLVAGQVEIARDVQFDAPAVEMLEEKAFDEAVVSAGVTIPPDERVTTKLLAWALGITPQGLNVNFFFGGQDAGLIAGFYDPRDQRIVVQKEGKLDTEYVVLAHEFVHAATDQAFDHPRKKVEPIVDDVSLATTALLEGDASLAELRVLSRLSPKKTVDKAVTAQIGFKDRFVEERDTGIPYLLIDTALFPYQSGLAFACAVFKEQGWKAIDRAYESPPTTTAQILFPDRFIEREEAIEPLDLSKPGPLWQLRDEGQIGAAHLKAMFEAPGDNETQALSRPLARAASWAGGRYQVWTVGSLNSHEYAVGLSFVEHKDYEGVLCSSLDKWYRTAFGDAGGKLIGDGLVRFQGTQQDALLSCQGREVTMAFARDLRLAKPILGLD